MKLANEPGRAGAEPAEPTTSCNRQRRWCWRVRLAKRNKTEDTGFMVFAWTRQLMPPLPIPMAASRGRLQRLEASKEVHCLSSYGY